MSAVRTSHATHAVPLAPQFAIVALSQVLPSQHPPQLPQLEQAPSQMSPCGQTAHCAPNEPHWLTSALPGWHLSAASQQPVHEVPSQTQAPCMQCWPVAHCRQAAPRA